MPKPKVVLAFSGGLDTSYCVKYLSQDQGMDVYSVTVDTGGFSSEEISQIENRARELGVVEHITLDKTQEFYEHCIKYLVYGNILRNQNYPLSVSAERVFQAMAIARYAQEIQAEYIAHGSTGAGNDQVRFDLAFQILAPELTILTPIRDQQLSRQAEVEYLNKHNVAVEEKTTLYSVNQGLWGTSVGGKETLTSHQSLPEEAYPNSLKTQDPQDIRLGFEKGEFKTLNGVSFSHPVEAIRALQELSEPYAIGRDIHVGDTIVGIKGRVGFEAPAPLMIIKAHQLLEKHVLSKWQIHWKEQMANWYGMFLHEGKYLDPVMRNIESFLWDTQDVVNGEVFIKLAPYRFELLGIESPHDLMQSRFGSYGEMNKAWTGEDVKGFTKVSANPLHIYYSVNPLKAW